jgi:uncharacterized protein with von Willebrand factor type A (vWA) domain
MAMMAATMAASDGSVKMSRMKLNPVREDYQDYTGSVKITRQLIVERMFPLICRRIAARYQTAAQVEIAA